MWRSEHDVVEFAEEWWVRSWPVDRMLWLSPGWSLCSDPRWPLCRELVVQSATQRWNTLAMQRRLWWNASSFSSAFLYRFSCIVTPAFRFLRTKLTCVVQISVTEYRMDIKLQHFFSFLIPKNKHKLVWSSDSFKHKLNIEIRWKTWTLEKKRKKWLVGEQENIAVFPCSVVRVSLWMWRWWKKNSDPQYKNTQKTVSGITSISCKWIIIATVLLCKHCLHQQYCVFKVLICQQQSSNSFFLLNYVV